ncbi:MAG TPA: carboxylesterase/lipase family protein [Dehalococcoidales bacterium]|nr:carboxylesterase/lipase family protein [Dehalococcoidales bacterium]
MNQTSNTVVQTQKGKVEGSFEDGLLVFRGIPYAAPPVGELRWMPPKPAPAWKGIRSARHFGPIAPQNPMVFEGLMGAQEPEPQSEDCLFLNIYTPGLDDKKRPVMVWIHGGAFSLGSGSMAMFRSGSLAKRGDVVLVTINYRLGILGFLNLKELTGGKIPSTGNEGLLDQVAALEWVKANIAGFGGDPDNVTIFGESAGGMSVACLMVLPKAQGLFHKAIIESAVGAIGRPLNVSVKIAGIFLKAVGLKATDIEALKALPIPAILAAHNRVALETGQGAAPFIPVADGKIMPLMPLEAFAAGKASPVPTIVGSNLDEQKLFSMMDPNSAKMDKQILVKMLERNVPQDKITGLIETYRQARLKRSLPVTPFELFSAINSDLMFRQIALHITSSQHFNSVPAYHYLFTWVSPAAGGALGACHGLEVGFVFGTYEPLFSGSGPGADKLCQQIQDAWTTFARTGNPSTKSLGKWLKYGTARNTMIISENCRLEKKVLEEERQAWEKVGQVNLMNML